MDKEKEISRYIINFQKTAFYFHTHRKLYYQYRNIFLKKLPASAFLVWYALQAKYKYFSKLKNFDGTFFYSNKRLSQETRISEDCIMRAKRLLRGQGRIGYNNGLYEGKATVYYFIEGSKLPPSQKQEGSKLSQEGSKLPLRGAQITTPIKVIKDTNKELKRFDPEVCKLIKETTKNFKPV